MKIAFCIISVGVIGFATYATYFQKGIPTPKVSKKSVRNRSVGHVYYSGGHRYGK